MILPTFLDITSDRYGFVAKKKTTTKNWYCTGNGRNEIGKECQTAFYNLTHYGLMKTKMYYFNISNHIIININAPFSPVCIFLKGDDFRGRNGNKIYE